MTVRLFGRFHVGMVPDHRQRERRHDGGMFVHVGRQLFTVQLLQLPPASSVSQASSRPVAIRGRIVQLVLPQGLLQNVPCQPLSCQGTRMVRC